MIDLHCHSYYSDGIHSPEELILQAKAVNLKCLSLTDHDTIAGLEELRQAGKKHAADLRIINGIELSTAWKKHVIHILGLNLENYQSLDALIERQNNNRIERAKKISLVLNDCGIKEAYSKACVIAGHERVGRPHFAKVLIDEGKVLTMVEAFKRYLGRGRSAYIPSAWASISEIVEEIKKAGGQAVIAHPLKYGLTRSKLHELIRDFKEAGGVGLEVVSGMMMAVHIKEMAATCLKFDLLGSSGSDYHGAGISRLALGRQEELPINCLPIWKEWNI